MLHLIWQLQDYMARSSAGESEVKFSLSRTTLEPMLRSMSYISDQLSTPANKVAVINLKLLDAETTSGESEVKFLVSGDTLGAMLRSMAYIREQLSNVVTFISCHQYIIGFVRSFTFLILKDVYHCLVSGSSFLCWFVFSLINVTSLDLTLFDTLNFKSMTQAHTLFSMK